MHSIYCPDSDLTQKHVDLIDKNELHHLRNVLRLRKGAPVHLFDGAGREARGTLVSVTSQKATVAIEETKQIKRARPLFILACALPKKSKFELIIEKATELGVDEIIPIITERTEIRLNAERKSKKQSRYQSIAINAAKQSKRSIVPHIHPLTNLNDALDALTKSTRVIIPSLSGEPQNIFMAFKGIKSAEAIALLIGPEGDFTPKEYAAAHTRGCIPVTLGPTILKVETAAICALSCAQLYFRT